MLQVRRQRVWAGGQVIQVWAVGSAGIQPPPQSVGPLQQQLGRTGRASRGREGLQAVGCTAQVHPSTIHRSTSRRYAMISPAPNHSASSRSASAAFAEAWMRLRPMSTP